MSSATTDGGSRLKRCAACRIWDAPAIELRTDEDHAAILAHYLDEHPDSDRLRAVVRDVRVEVACQDCGRPFETEVSVGDGEFLASAFCDVCGDHGHPIRQSVVQELSARDLITHEVDDE